MSDTSGPNLPASSVSTALQSSLERLRARLAEAGSPLYGLIWKDWAMVSGPQICALRASAPRTSAKGSGGEVFTGWPTPRTVTGGAESAERKQELGRTASGGGDLQAAALSAGWPTPKVSDFKGADLARSENRTGARHSGDGLATVVTMAGWPTPTTTDATRGSPETPEAKRARGAHTGTSMIDAAHLMALSAEKSPGPMRLTSHGELRTGSSAGTESGGQLNRCSKR
jgi:hypothetical protein